VGRSADCDDGRFGKISECYPPKCSLVTEPLQLSQALAAFDRVAVTLQRLEETWAELAKLTPAGLGASPDALRYGELCRTFDALAKGLPAVSGLRVLERPMPLDEITGNRWDANEIGEVDAHLQVEAGIEAPGEGIAAYRHAYRLRRRDLVRRRADELVTAIDGVLPLLTGRNARGPQSVADDPDWQHLDDHWRELLSLVGEDQLRGTRAVDFSRHLHFAQSGDLWDISEHDWPSVKSALDQALYSTDEPLPVEVDDLDELVTVRPVGPVSTRINFDVLEGGGFERLLFELLSTTPGYANANWLTETNAPDRGRDLQVERIIRDPLTGTSSERIIVQAKHWKRSLNLSDCKRALDPIETWEPPPVAELIIATTGRFTTDAISWIEQHNNAGGRPKIVMWADSTIERFLAGRGDLVAEFNLRAPA